MEFIRTRFQRASAEEAATRVVRPAGSTDGDGLSRTNRSLRQLVLKVHSVLHGPESLMAGEVSRNNQAPRLDLEAQQKVDPSKRGQIEQRR